MKPFVFTFDDKCGWERQEVGSTMFSYQMTITLEWIQLNKVSLKINPDPAMTLDLSFNSASLYMELVVDY